MGKRLDNFVKGLKELFVGKEEIIKQIDLLPEDVLKGLQKIFGSVLQQLPEIKAPLAPVETGELERMAARPVPDIPGMDLPPIREGKEFEFGPIEEAARAGFEQRTIPGLAERFAGMGGLKSSGFAGALGQAGSDLERQLAALRSQYGLAREGMDIERGAQEQRRGVQAGQLGLARQELLGQLGGQRFGQLGALADLGMRQRGQELDRRQLLTSLLGLGAQRPTQTLYTPATQGLLSPQNIAGVGQRALQTLALGSLV
jgi:hypothetical protein